MPVPTTSAELLDVVRKSDLVAPARLDGFLQEHPDLVSLKPHDLSTRLIAAGIITHFQSEQFLQGKWRRFTIGKYKVLERLGSGGMGTVYLCEHLTVCRKVAIKVLPTSQNFNPSAMGRFRREARAAGVIDHPNLVKAHDFDCEGDLHFLVMDYVDGSSLQDIVTRFGPMGILRACHYIRQAATALQAALDAGLIHRDIKPANIMLERNGRIRVLDLGLARFYDDDVDMLTLKYDNQNVLGTADYVAPEQALDSHTADIRADIYSLGGTFYFLLTGQVPFPGGKVAQKLIWHQVRPPDPIRKLRPEVPEELEALVQRMMAKDRDDRFQTPAEVIQALHRWTRDPIEPPAEQEMPRLSPAATAATTSSVSAARPMVTPMQRKSWPGTTPRVPQRPESSVQVSTLEHSPSAAEMATPRDLSRAQTPTETEQPRPAPAVAPSRVLHPSVVPAPLMERAGLGISVIVIAFLSGMIGVGLTAWFLLR
ncbi:MAG: protein kinase [Gemmataceae bacterium]